MEKMQKVKKSKAKNGLWLGVIMFGLVGQIAWIIENMYLNVFLYKTITFDLGATSAMVAASAIVATLTTLFMGVLSDKVGKRKLFMSLGYIIWGFTVMLFSAISVDGIKAIFPNGNAVVIATVLIVVLDCVMTFFGSTANDAAFNAWITDNTVNKNRGKVEGVLQIMPLAALLVVFGLLDGLTQNGNWTAFYLIVGGVTTLAGVGSLFFLKDSKQLVPKEGAYFKDIFHGFKPSTVKKNSMLYFIFLAMCLVSIGNNVYMPYLMIYIEFFLGFSDYVILLGIVMMGAAIVSVAFGFFADKVDKRLLFIPAFVLYVVGGIGMFFATSMAAVAIAGLALMAGNLSIFVLLASLARIKTPKKEVGLFQGIRMVFMVLVPMSIGPAIGALVSVTSNAVYIDPATLIEQPVPSNYIFLVAVAITLLALIPILIMTLYKKGAFWKKSEAENAEASLIEEINSDTNMVVADTQAAENVENSSKTTTTKK